mgnify:CR=1 FL=1
MKRSGVAAVLSFLFSGLGQLYNGQIIKGLVVIFFTGVSLLFILLGGVFIYLWLKQSVTLEFLWLGGILFIAGVSAICIIGIYSIFDAYREAERQ